MKIMKIGQNQITILSTPCQDINTYRSICRKKINEISPLWGCLSGHPWLLEPCAGKHFGLWMNASWSCFCSWFWVSHLFFSPGEMRLLDDGLGSPEELDQLLALVESRRLVAATDALSADEDPGHGSTPGQNAHVVLNFAGLWIARNIFD